MKSFNQKIIGLVWLAGFFACLVCTGESSSRIVRDINSPSLWKPSPVLLIIKGELILDKEKFLEELYEIIHPFHYHDVEVLLKDIEEAANRLRDKALLNREIEELIEDYIDKEILKYNRLGLEVTQSLLSNIRYRVKTEVSQTIRATLFEELSERIIRDLREEARVTEDFLDKLEAKISKLSFELENEERIPESHKDYIKKAFKDSYLIKNTFFNLFGKENVQMIKVKITPVTKNIEEYLRWNTYMIWVIAKSGNEIFSTRLLLKLQLRRADQNPTYFSNLKKCLEEISESLDSSYITRPGAWERIREGGEDMFIFTQESLMHTGVFNLLKKSSIELETEAVKKLLQAWKKTIRADPLQERGTLIKPYPGNISIFRDITQADEYQIRLVGLEGSKKVSLLKVYRTLISEKYNQEAIKRGFEEVFWPGILEELLN